MFNPRFPHMLRVWRSVKDYNGEPMTTDEGDPIYEVVELDEERKAAMVTNLLVVLCADESAQPVVNAGTMHH